MDENNIKISIVIPVYNVEKYLLECLDSIFTQSLQDIQVICVDDGSSDTSLQILQQYALSEPRLVIIEQENCGVSVARNSGLARAHGVYVFFMDSDDYFDNNNVLMRIFTQMQQEDLDVLSFNYRTIGFEERQYTLGIPADTIMTGQEYLLLNGRANVMPWLRVLKKAYLDRIDLKFTPNIAGEDDETLPKIFFYAKKVKHIDETVMVYRRRENSISTSKPTFKVIRGLSAIIYTYYDLYTKAVDKELKRVLYNSVLEHIFILYENIFIVDETDQAKKVYENILSEISFSPLEERLIANEEKYIYYYNIEKKGKKYKWDVYYKRRFRILYFKYLHRY